MELYIVGGLAAALGALCSTLFALWIKTGLAERLNKLEVCMNDKVDNTVFKLHNESLEKSNNSLEKTLSEVAVGIKELSKKVDEKLDQGEKFMHELDKKLAVIEQSIPPLTKPSSD